jgi:ATP-dependent Lon protease
MFGKRNKLLQLIRLVPFCERNYNLIELGPKGTGKSHVYSEFSPHGILISGGEVTVPKLFVSNSSGKLGLVGYWDVVAFDEFAGKQKKVDKALVDIMKNYMANKSFSRGVETLGAEASMVFVGNTDHTVPYMLKHSDLFDPLPEKFHDSAFLDRVHSYIPGWEVDVIRGEMFSSGYGFVVDYLAEILKSLRSHDFSDRYKKHFSLSEEISTRDRDGINKTFSGLMKILYPQGEATEAEVEDVLRTAIEGRKRVKDQLLRIDSTYPEVRFAYEGKDGQEKLVHTLEEDEYPNQYHRRLPIEGQGQPAEATPANTSPNAPAAAPLLAPPKVTVAPEAVLKEQHLVFQENQRGVSFDTLIGPYLAGAKRIVITDPYMRIFHQLRNLMDLMETISKFKGPDEEVAVHAVTVEDEFNGDRQSENLQKIADACQSVGIQFTWAYDTSGTKHDRDITTDHGWKLVLSRGIDVFQRYELNETFNFANRLQQYRPCKEFNVTYVRVKPT